MLAISARSTSTMRASARSKACGFCGDGWSDDAVKDVPRVRDARMLAVARYAIGRSLARLHRLSFVRDPVLLQGREGRWHWPWAINGLLLTALLFVLLSIGVIVFEDVAVRQNWVRGGFP